jgi:hypothetical protein
LTSDPQLANRYEKVTVIRFGRNSDPACTAMDEILWKCEPRCKKFGEFYVVDIGGMSHFLLFSLLSWFIGGKRGREICPAFDAGRCSKGNGC